MSISPPIPKLTVLVSGKGTTLHAILKAIDDRALRAQVYHVISNKKDVPALDPEIIRAQGIELTIPSASIVLWDRKVINRAEYDRHLAKNVLKHSPDLVVLAGFMHILGPTFFETLNNDTNFQPPQMINLHPALPGQFPGAHGIRDAYEASKRGEITYTGSMVHEVIPEIDAGKVLGTTHIPIYSDDHLEDLEHRIKYHEKPLLIQCIQKCLAQSSISPHKSMLTPRLLCRGKVRDIWEMGYGLLALVATNRTSSFDRQICEVPQKGAYLTQTSAWWFRKTQPIIPNHMVYTKGNLMVVKKCRVIPIEVVIRGYITGSTQTSLWTHYQKGVRNYCGIQFPDGLKKNQRLSRPVVTPTTKSDIHDEPISAQEIIKRKIVGEQIWQYIEQKALELFEFASQRALQAGMILADTKLEFGVLPDPKSEFSLFLDHELEFPDTHSIILIDEAFTPDSSRYWRASTYHQRLQAGQEPDNLDKDLIRHYVRSQISDPYTQAIPPIPEDVIQKVRTSYDEFFWTLNGLQKYNPISMVENIPETLDSYFHNVYGPACLILAEDEAQVLSAQLPELQRALEEHHLYCMVETIPCSPISRPKVSILLEDYQECLDFNPKRKLATIVLTSKNNPSTALLEMASSELKTPLINCLQMENMNHLKLNLPVAHFVSPEQCAKFVAKILKI